VRRLPQTGPRHDVEIQSAIYTREGCSISTFVTKCLNANWFRNLADAKEKISRWREDCDCARPHSGRGIARPTSSPRAKILSSIMDEKIEAGHKRCRPVSLVETVPLAQTSGRHKLRFPRGRPKRSRIAAPPPPSLLWSLRSLFCSAGHLVSGQGEGSELRGNANYEAHHTDLKQIPLR
jgi:hypothetical protein